MAASGNGWIHNLGAPSSIEGDLTLNSSNTPGRLASRCFNRQFAGIAIGLQKVGGLSWIEVEKQSTLMPGFSRTPAAGRLPPAVGSAGPDREQLRTTLTGKAPISQSGLALRLAETLGIGACLCRTALTTHSSSW